MSRTADGGGRPRGRTAASAVILAGGGSRRMGQDKALLPVGGRPLIARTVEQLAERFDDILISAGPSDRGLRFPGVTVVPDDAPGLGPLMGLASALPRARHALAFVVACDIPDIDLAFVARLIARARGHDAALPERDGGLVEPLFAVYRTSVAGAARKILDAGGRSVLDLLERIDAVRVPVPPGVRIGNVNTRSDYRELLRGFRRL